MGDSTAPARPPPWTKTSKTVCATLFPSGPKLRPKLSADTLALIHEDVLSLSRIALIGFAPTRHPTRIELQEWINVNLVEPTMIVTRIRMLQRGYFVLTFDSESGAKGALQLRPLNFGTHLIYLQPWRPQFDPQQPAGIRFLLWIRFPKLDDVFYRALPDVCAEIGEVIWTGKQEEYLKKSSTPRVSVLVADVKSIPSSIFLPIPLTTDEVEITLEYEGIPWQCSYCLELEHDADKCPHKKKKKKTSTKTPVSAPITKTAVVVPATTLPAESQLMVTDGPINNSDAVLEDQPLSTQELEGEALAVMDTLALYATGENSHQAEPLPVSPSEDPNTWIIIGKKSKVLKSLPKGPLLPGPSPSKKRPIHSSLLEQQMWDTLNFLNTPRDGEKRLQIWPVIFSTGKETRTRYHSLLQGQLQGTSSVSDLELQKLHACAPRIRYNLQGVPVDVLGRCAQLDASP